MKKTVAFDLDDLRVESFETLPELTNDQAALASGARAASSCDGANTCFTVCDTGDETVVCCYPTQGNGSGEKEAIA